MRIQFFLFWFIGFVCAQSNFALAATIDPVGLRCESLVDPLGIDTPQPHLCWTLAATDSKAYGQRQTKYEILVASRAEWLEPGKANLWDSGEVKSDDCRNIAYGGAVLKSNQDCFWKVRSADENGAFSQWSEPAKFSVGLLSNDDWKAKWIASPKAVAQKVEAKQTDNMLADPWLRKTFDLKEKPTRAVIYVASIGYHELYVNGEKIGDAVLAPSATDYARRARYVTYDITSHLKPGRNVIGLWLGTGWSDFPAYQTDDKPAVPIVIAQASIQFVSAPAMEIATDETWKTHDSPNLLLGYFDAHGFGGEKYDARLELPGWSDASLDDSDWTPAIILSPKLQLAADKTEPNRLVKEIIPIAVKEITNGFQIDMGVNYAGWFQMPVEGNPGDVIEFQFSEEAKSAMTHGIHSQYIIGPSGKGVFCNRFNYMAGRYVTVTGTDKKPQLTLVKGWNIRTAYARAGEFKCDQPLLNQIYQMTNWTFENLTIGSYLVDCPQRERRGYGDGFGSMREAFDNYGMSAFCTKWSQDWCDVQKKDGDVPFTAPTILGGGGPAWSGFCISLPWKTFERYGDKRVLADSYPTMQKWLAFLETKSRDNLLQRYGGNWGFLGDWEWPNYWNERRAIQKTGKFLGDTPQAQFFNNCNWIYNLVTAARVADVLEDATSANAYRLRADEIRKTVHAKFFNSADNSYVDGYQAPLAIALLVDLPPQDLRAAVWKRLETEIVDNRKGHIWAGIIGGGFLFETLLDHNRNDLIYTMASKTDFPSWGNMIARGVSTFPEDWNLGGTGLHSSYLYIGGWFIEGLGGIKQSDCGYKHIVIEPWIDQVNGPREVKASYESPYGKIVSKWTKDERGNLSMGVVIPPNTDAVVKMRGAKVGSIKLGEQPGNVGEDGGVVTLKLAAGHYTIEALMDKNAGV